MLYKIYNSKTKYSMFTPIFNSLNHKNLENMNKNLLVLFFLMFSVTMFAQQKGDGVVPGKKPVKFERLAVPDSENRMQFNAANQQGNFHDNSGVTYSTPDGGVVRGCGFNAAEEFRRQQNPMIPSVEQFENWMKVQLKQQEQVLQNAMLAGPRCDIMYIPYIVHVLHEGEDVNTVGSANSPNISAAQVQSQIDVLNEVYRKMNFDRNDDPIWDDVSADFRIQFVPALFDPATDEVIPEPGINRVDLIEEGLPTTWNSINAVFTAFDNQIKPATQWDPEMVLNMWVADFFQSSGGLLGYAQFPSMSGLPGLNADGGAANTDGVVMSSDSFQNGADDDGSFMDPPVAAFSNGQTTTHEIGHWLGLRHIWGDTGCGGDDFVDDTPLQGQSTNGCPANQDSCTGDDLPDMIPNYMDYTNDVCMNIYTQGQAARKDVVMSMSPRRMELVNSPLGDYPATEPFVFFEVEDLRKNIVEAEGCAAFKDYMIRARLKDCVDGGSPTATITVGTTDMVEGVDYDFMGDNTVTFAGTGPEVIGIPVRFYSDGDTEGVEDIAFEISITDADGSDAVLHPDDLYTEAIWSVDDATEPDMRAEVGFTEDADVDIPACVGGDLTLTITFDNFPEETSWEITDDGANVVASGGPYGAEPDGSTLDIPISLGAGNYTFTMFDSWGDGIFAPGGYTLSDSNGGVAVSEDNFGGSSQSDDFCVNQGNTFNGILGIDATIQEVENCGDVYAEYLIAISSSACVTGEQDFTAMVEVDPASTATLGDDFTFPMGATVDFTGEDGDVKTLPIRFIGDGMIEGAETLILNITLSDDVADLGVSTSTITILDSDLPLLSLSADTERLNEAEYVCDGDSNTFQVTVSAEGCPGDNVSVPFTLVVADGSEATADDINIVGGGSFTFTSENIDEPVVFTIEVLDDGLIEGEELITFDIQLANPTDASIANQTSVFIRDPQGVFPPALITAVGADFEDGLPDGWSMLSNLDPSPNNWTISNNTDLDGAAAHITSDLGSNPFTYVNSGGGNNDVFLISPPFNAAGKAPLDFMFQVQGEPGFFGAFDFGFAGVVQADTDITSPAALIGDLFGYLLLGEPAPTTLTEWAGGEEQDAGDLISAAGYDGDVRFVFLWRSDFSVTNNPPFGVDEFAITGGNFIERNTMIGEEIPSYEIDSDIETFYYNLVDDEVAMSIQSSSDHGCSSGFVSSSGTGTTQFISDFSDEFRTSKSFAVETPNPDEDADLTVGLYYTEDEIAGWEDATGRDRSELYMFKTMGYKLAECCTEVEVNITLDNFPGETTWAITDGGGAEVAAGGPYAGADNPVSETILLADGDYTFTIFDSFGDGICCGFGNGSYSVAVNGEMIVSGGDFEDSESTSFTAQAGEELDLCPDYRDIDFAKASLEPYADGFKVVASFETGLADQTGFSLSALPLFTPGEFTAVQNEEQIDITFVNRFPVISDDDDALEISYILLEEYTRDLEWVELKTIAATEGQSSFEVVDFFPYVGINRYRVGAVLSNGDVIYACYEADEFYESTNDFQVGPNPATNNINIVISDGNIEGDLDMEIYDAQGRLVMDQDLISYSGVMRFDVDISSLAVGQYYIRVESGDGHVRSATFVKARN